MASDGKWYPPDQQPGAPAPPGPQGWYPQGPAAQMYGQPGAAPYGAPFLPALPAADRVFAASQRRSETDYIFSYWSALGWTVLTLGFFGLYVIYQLVRRMRDHNIRRIEMLDAALTFTWEQAGIRGLQSELTPAFQRADSHMAVLRRMTTDFREPTVWLLLSIVGRGIAEIVLFVLLDQDLVKHDCAEIGVEYELSLIFGRLGQALPSPDQSRLKGENNYVGRIVATFFSLGIYMFWWYHDQMNDPNRHFHTNWVQEDSLVQAVQALR
jgi:hypothetical protein